MAPSLKQVAHQCGAPSTTRGSATVLSADAKGKLLVYTSGLSVILRDIENPNEAKVYTGHTNPVTCAKISPSTYYCASGDDQGNVRIWATNNEDLTLKLETRPLSGPILDIAWSPDSQRVVVVGQGKDIFGVPFLMDSGATVGAIIGHAEPILTTDFKPTRPFRVVTGGEDKQVVIHAGPPFKHQATQQCHTNSVNCVRYSPDGNMYASVSSDKKIMLFDGKTGDIVGEIPCDHKGSVYQCSWTGDSKQLLTTSADKTCKLWDVTEKSLVCTFKFSDTSPDYMQVGGVISGSNIISLSLNGELNYLNKESPEAPAKIIRGHQKPITCCAYDIETNKLYTASATDSVILQWSGKFGQGSSARVQGKGHTSIVSGLAIMDGALVSCGMDNQICFTDPNTNTYGEKVEVKGGPNALVPIPNKVGTIVVTTQQSIAIIKEKQIVFELKVDWTPLCAAATSTQVAVGGKDKAIHLFNIEGDKLTEFQVLTGVHTGAVQALNFNSAGTQLASGDANRVVSIWDVDANEYKTKGHAMTHHTSAIKSVGFSPNGKYLATAGSDCWLFVKDLENLDSKASVRAHSNGCNSAMFLDDDILVSVGGDFCVSYWSLSE